MSKSKTENKATTASPVNALVMPQQLPTKAKIKLIGGKETICPVKRIDFRDGEVFRVNLEYALDEKHNQYLTYYFDGRMMGEEGDIDVYEIFLGFVV